MGVSKDDSNRSEEDAMSTPLPGETLALFYARSREYWARKALERSDNRGKMLRRDGFSLAEETYGTSYFGFLTLVSLFISLMNSEL